MDMAQTHLIAIADICTHHDIEYAFISSLSDAGLVEITITDNDTFIPEDELHKLEKMIRMHQELEINLAGIEAIVHLLQRVENMQEELRILKNYRRLASV